MDRLWAPWRIKYVKAKKQNRCIFCRAVKSRGKNYVIFKTGYSIAMLNIFPYNNGHVMLAPLRHIRDFTLLKEAEVLDLFRSLNKISSVLQKVLKPQGYNIGINMAESAGAGIAAHMHIHIVPRWKGDTNFMPILSDTKIIPESLNELYKRLKDAE